MSTFLPQHDPNPTARASLLKSAQDEYRYNYTYVSPLAIVERLPVKDEFSFEWLKIVAECVATMLSNRTELEVASEFRDFHTARLNLMKLLIEAAELKVGGLRQMVVDVLKFDMRVGASNERAKTLDDFRNLFRTIGLPPVASDFGDDRAFAWLRVAGPNPVMLHRQKARDERITISDAEFALVIPGDSQDAALADGRLYLADYAILDGAAQGDYPNGRKYLYAPLALFVIDRTTHLLRPVAIQCRQQPAQYNPVFTPLDGHNWLLAKTIVEIADGNVHEAVTHLARTHLFIEPFVLATFRQLAPSHPLARLLAPHFEGTLAINEAAWRHLVANKGAVDKLCGGSIEASRGLAVKAVQTHLVSHAMFPRTFADRGVDDVGLFPHYPYRDDSLLYWNAIGQWVSDYLQLYYHSDEEVSQDSELQAWYRELAAQEGGRISGLADGGTISRVADLCDLATLILSTCSVQHAAVNFPQYDIMSYVPQMPLAGYSAAPTAKTGATEADYLAMLPTLDVAELQVELGYILGSVRYTQLGRYRADWFDDQRVLKPMADFQKNIAAIGATITERNLARLRPYGFLEPAGIPQSINI
jgi:arachidonate 15-lipoxygenase